MPDQTPPLRAGALARCFRTRRDRRRIDIIRAGPHLARDIGLDPLPRRPMQGKWGIRW